MDEETVSALLCRSRAYRRLLLRLAKGGHKNTTKTKHRNKFMGNNYENQNNAAKYYVFVGYGGYLPGSGI
jgi:hypothetical protein